MPLKVRTLESYLAGLGASGALIAGAFVAFVLLVGIVTFDAWPTGSSVFSQGAGDIKIDTSLTDNPPAREEPNVPNLVQLLGGGAATTAPAQAGGAGGAGSQAPATPNTNPGTSPGRERGPQDNGPQGGQRTPAEPTQPAPANQPVGAASNAAPAERNAVQQLVYGVGNTVEADTSSLGETLGGQDTLLGGLVGGLGSTLNGTLQGLAGNK